MISAEFVRAYLAYDQNTGVFTWANGKKAGWVEPKGYVRICILGKNYQAHRLAWLWMTGNWPCGQIDHINLDKADNRWPNLREATNSQNQANTRAKRVNTSGFKGVYWHRRIGKWHAAISVNGRLKALGYTDTKEEAAALYQKAARKYFGEFARSQ